MDERIKKKLKKKFEDFLDVELQDSDIPVSEKKARDTEERDI